MASSEDHYMRMACKMAEERDERLEQLKAAEAEADRYRVALCQIMEAPERSDVHMRRIAERALAGSAPRELPGGLLAIGCPSCGFVTTLPKCPPEGGKIPWCAHVERLIWRAPGASSEGLDWSPMIPMFAVPRRPNV